MFILLTQKKQQKNSQSQGLRILTKIYDQDEGLSRLDSFTLVPLSTLLRGGEE